MATAGQDTAGPTNWLDGYLIPDELKLIILGHISSHRDLFHLSKAYPEWTFAFVKKYEKKKFTTLWDSVLSDIDQDLDLEVIIAYQIRKVRKDYATAMGSSQETHQDRDELEHNLRGILSLHKKKVLPTVAENLETIIDMGNVVRDVNSLTHRYSNEGWKRVRGVAEATGTGPLCSTGNPTTIKLSPLERFNFQRAFLRVEIYLLTKFWTNAQGDRHVFNMGEDILTYIPHSNHRHRGDRYRFDSCLRYMFDAYRSYLKKTARELGAPELPPRDDLPWVRNRNENYKYEYNDYKCEFEDDKYEFEDYPTLTNGDPRLDFEHRSVSEEQCLLLWLCERGIGPLEQTHQAGDSERRDELLQQFSRRHVWETVELRHRFSRYDWRVDFALSRLAALPDPHYNIRNPFRDHRNRHPVMSLYGQDEHQRYSDKSSPWACASVFLTWQAIQIEENRRAILSIRDNVLSVRRDMRLVEDDFALKEIGDAILSTRDDELAIERDMRMARDTMALVESRDAVRSTRDDTQSLRDDILLFRGNHALKKIRKDTRLVRAGICTVRDDIALNKYGSLVMGSDTDMGRSCWTVFRRRPGMSALPHGHPYMFEPEKYELRPYTRRHFRNDVP